jgi:outer membrane protein OmpA-like peptidoglycan-associated protein
MKSLRKSTLIAVIVAIAVAACATDERGQRRPLTDTQRGAIFGAATGAVIGGLASKNKKKGILIGAIGGGLAGTAVGAYMDKQKQDLEKVLAPERNAGAIQVDKLNGDVLRVTMTDQTAFDSGSARIKPGFDSTMNKVAQVVSRYGKTFLTVVGHTDSVGSTQYNQRLSEQRARAVAQYFESRGVISERLAAEGKGETAPRASNATPDGRRLNRRVEVYIEPVVAQS